MTRLRTNIIASFAGQAAATLIQFVITPIYIHWLGIEAYGLIGFQVTLQALTQALDLGLSPTVNRELARYSVLPGKAEESRDFVRTLEAGYWLLGVVIGLAIYAAAPYLSTHWLRQASLPTPVVLQSLRIIAILIAVQWPLTFYQGGLLGLQRHPSLNVIRVAMTAVAAAGGYWVVIYVSPTVTAFFAWQAVVCFAHVGLVTWLLWRSLPASTCRPRIRLSAVRHAGRFAGGMTIITITALILTQLDRVVLSRLVSLEQFGYYVVAGLFGNGLYALISPMFMSIFPRFSTLAASGDDSALDHTYRRAWQLMIALVVPIAAVVAVFSSELLLLWTRDSAVARVAAPIASFLVVGTALNGLMNVPYALQLARGWTSLGVKVNLMLTIVACPAILLAAQRYGTFGVATVWPALMVLYMLVALPITHRVLLPGIGVLWFMRDVAFPTCLSVLAVALFRVVLPGAHSTIWMSIQIVLAWFTAAMVLVLSQRDLRADAVRQVLKLAGYARNRSLEMSA